MPWSEGRDERTTPSGWTWRHYPCPRCPDHGRHYGIGSHPSRGMRARCWLCGFTGLPSWANRKAQDRSGGKPDPRYREPPPRRSWATGRAFPALSAASPSDPRRVGILRGAASSWQGVDPCDVLTLMGYVPEEEATAVGGYWSPSGEVGLFFRRWGAGVGPARETIGTHSLGTLSPGAWEEGGPLVLVEGYGDALAVPYPYVPVILFGLGNLSSGTLPPLGGKGREVILLLDRDEPGRVALRKGLILLLRAGVQELSYVEDYPGKDPGEVGKVVLGELLPLRKKVRGVLDLPPSL